MAKLGKSQREKNSAQVASVAAFDSRGHLLFGRRSDNKKWTLPGGHLNPGEAPERGAVRELREETGLRASNLDKLGSEELSSGLVVHAFTAEVDGDPSAADDPDEEIEEFRWVDPSAIPEEIRDNLHSPRNVTLHLLGLQDWNKQDEEELEKMALADVPVGPKLGDEDGETFDYSHVLPSGAKESGYSLAVHHLSPEGLIAQVSYRDMHGKTVPAGFVEGEHSGSRMHLLESRLGAFHRKKGIGRAMYEALLAHAKNHLGVEVLEGGTHSTSADGVHRSLAVKHGMTYKATANRPAPPDQPQGYEYDHRFNAYEYQLKSEVPMTKAVDTHLEDDASRLLQHPDLRERSMALKHTGLTAAHLVMALRVLRAEGTPESKDHQRLRHALLQQIVSHPQANDQVKIEARSMVPAGMFLKFEDELAPWLRDLRKHARGVFDGAAGRPDSGADGVTAMQAYIGARPKVDRAMAAAQFLAGHEADDVSRHVAAVHQDHDPVAAALEAHGLGTTNRDRADLLAVQGLVTAPTVSFEASKLGRVEPATNEAMDFARACARAGEEGEIKEVHWGGKHSAGMKLVKDPDGLTLLVKPGGGPQNPAAGEQEDPSTQSQREVGFYHGAVVLGLQEVVPRAELLLVDGKQAAALEFEGGSYGPLEDLREKDQPRMYEVLERHRQTGQLHQWAAMDAILGNVDRHFGNVLVDDEGNVKLIDHGSAFAGFGFDPAHNRATFTPCYLRYRCPVSVNLYTLTSEERQHHLEQASGAREVIKAWLDGIDAERLALVLHACGIDPAASLHRLLIIRNMAEQVPVDVAINRYWAEA